MHVIPVAGKENRYKVRTVSRGEAKSIAKTLSPAAGFALSVVATLCRPGRVPTFGADRELLSSIQEKLAPPCPNLDRFLGKLGVDAQVIPIEQATAPAVSETETAMPQPA